MSGEVTVSVPDLIEYQQEYEKIKPPLPSQHQIEDKVKLCVMPEGEENFPAINAEVIAIHFYAGKVKYDLEINFAGDMCTRMYNIDSVLVLKR